MPASLAGLVQMSIRQRLVEQSLYVMNALFRQLEGNKPHHQPNQGIDNALRFSGAQTWRQPCRQDRKTKEPEEGGADRTERKPALGLNVQLSAQAAEHHERIKINVRVK